MKKVLSLFALCAMFAFAGCAKNKEEQKHVKSKEHVKKEQKKKDHKKKDHSKKKMNASHADSKKKSMYKKEK